MLFDKLLSDVTYNDIQELSYEKIDESMLLDYKQELNDTGIIKQVTAFSNTKGGYLVYGIAETGKGGHPEYIIGIEMDTNTERLEQIILSNIVPRVSVQMKKIPIPDTDRIILVVQIPEGQNKPYYNNHDKKYYKRYNFSATPMDENEIEWLYQSRFFGMSKLDRYVEEAIFLSQNRIPHEIQLNGMEGHVIITPLKIDGQMFDPSPDFGHELTDLHSNRTSGCTDYLSGPVMPSKFGIKWDDEHYLQNKDSVNKVEIHRNGLVHSMKRCGSYNPEGSKELDDDSLACNLLQTIRFTASFYSKISYMGKVKIMVKVFNCTNSFLTDGKIKPTEARKCDSEEISIERQWDSWKLEEDHVLISRDIMDEVSNYYGLWNSRLFEEQEGIVSYGK
ncbi:ATP-binding protein [Methanolobus sp.]|uniref:AlbA family DNA-binding domain-containing protein n=1 Tax=Methanolobus sp. TaxID=1874737 RepID=UPI0025CF8E17|nr:ATP-binding protein [Methanolobus sp.]